MLDEVLTYLGNWFLKDIQRGEFEIKDGRIELPFLLHGQYFRILGSVLNDGVYQYPAENLQDERFDGAVWALAVPKAVADIAQEVTDWQAKYGAAAAAPYTMESFGGYSYTKASTGGANGASAWQDAFKARLIPWRKLGGVTRYEPFG